MIPLYAIFVKYIFDFFRTFPGKKKPPQRIIHGWHISLYPQEHRFLWILLWITCIPAGFLPVTAACLSTESVFLPDIIVPSVSISAVFSKKKFLSCRPDLLSQNKYCIMKAAAQSRDKRSYPVKLRQKTPIFSWFSIWSCFYANEYAKRAFAAHRPYGLTDGALLYCRNIVELILNTGSNSGT